MGSCWIRPTPTQTFKDTLIPTMTSLFSYPLLGSRYFNSLELMVTTLLWLNLLVCEQLRFMNVNFKVEKAGANALFEEPNNGSNNIGVVVSPVRIKCLEEFGTPQFVADKLINAEKRKESTKEAEVVSVGERSGGLQKQVYEFEYKIDSTRGGIKRVFSAAFVSSNKLYLLNVVHSDKPENPLDSNTTLLLEQVLHSFDALHLQ